jgi:phosphatidylglycerol:prolipoprotein diacylglycerol transferase
MRQTLLRIRLDDIWSMAPIDGITGVGLGYVVLVIWSLMAANWAMATFRRDGLTRDDLPGVLIWFGSAAALLAIGQWLIPARFTSIPVYGYGFMLFLGFFSAAWLAMRRAKSVGLSGDLIWDLAVWLIVSGIGGARLLYVIRFPENVFAGKVGPAKFWAIFNLPDGGLVLYGGVILGLLVFFWFCRRRKLNPLLMADVIVPSFFVGLAFGRLGCFLNGCCYGDVCSLPWAVQFPEGSATFAALVGKGFLSDAATATMSLHPTQIYSSINAVVLAILTATYFKHRHQNGAVLALALCTYPVTRFVIEYLRSDELTVVMTIRTALLWGDEVTTFSTPFTPSQWVSLVLFSIGLIFAGYLQRRARGAVLATPPTGHTPAAA